MRRSLGRDTLGVVVVGIVHVGVGVGVGVDILVCVVGVGVLMSLLLGLLLVCWWYRCCCWCPVGVVAGDGVIAVATVQCWCCRRCRGWHVVVLGVSLLLRTMLMSL